MSGTRAVFQGLDDSNKEAVWVTDGSVAGTSELVSGSSLGPHDLTVFGNEVLFVADGQASPGSQHLWITDGTVGGTSELNVPGSDRNFDVSDITSIGGKALFYGVSATTGLGLWVTDGTSAGTSEIVHAFNPQRNLTEFGGGALFGSGTSTFAQHLWKTDGTTNGTSDITPASASTGLSSSSITVVAAQAYFIGNSGLWITDGTAAGTSEVTISGGRPSLTPDLTAFGSKLLFEGLDTAGHLNLFITDGTTAGTSELNTPSTVGSLVVSNITTLGGKALFTGAQNTGDVGLWVTDGRVGGTSELVIPGQESIGPFSELNPTDLTLFGGRVLFAGNDSRSKEGLWITDGTAAGTTEIFAPPLTWSGLNPHAFTVSGNEAYFLGQGANRQVGVWVTDGTTAGTSEVNVPHVSLGGLNPQEIVSFNPLCFHHGTRIATPSGETPVQDLRAGDPVLTADGAVVPVRWIGERRIDLTRHSDPAAASPIRIRRGALADGVPGRDLLVSPDHAMLLDGLLIPARLLVNDATILRETGLSAVHYFHVELDAHGILLAEGAASESYLDTGNRSLFDNAGVPLVLHPDFLSKDGQVIRERDSCAPFAGDAARVRPVWDGLAERASELGYALPSRETTSEPDLRVAVDGREIRPVSISGDEYVFALPRGCGEAHLLSRAAAPCDTAPWVEDRRRLGVMVRRIALAANGELRVIAPDDPSFADGWWEAEGDAAGPWRWTDGDATLPEMTAPAVLRVVCCPAFYPAAVGVDPPRVRRVA